MSEERLPRSTAGSNPRVCAALWAALIVAGGCSAPGGDAQSAPGALSTGNGNGNIPGGTIDLGDSTQTSGACDNVLEVVYRDFSEAHADFEMPFPGDVVRRMLVMPTLDAERKPVFRDSIGCPIWAQTPDQCGNQPPVIQSAESFNQWYRSVPGVNIEQLAVLELTDQPTGSGNYVFDSVDFFPLGPNDGFGVSPAGHYLGKNFLFTTEIHVTFSYVAGQVFAFRGDDDLWVFVNGRLAMDLGSVHSPAEGRIDFDAQAAELGITPGGSYPMDIFHAERHTTGSNFRFQTNISCFTPADIK